MRRAQSRGAAHQRWRRLALRSRALVSSTPARPHPDRRGAWRRGAGSSEGVGHRTPWRPRHAARRVGAGRAAPPRAAHPGSGCHRPARADRRDHRPDRRAVGARFRAPPRRTRRCSRTRSRRGLRPHPCRRTLMPHTRARRAFVAASTFALLALATAPAYAPGSNMPWEQPLTQILDSVQGPVAKVISVIIIVITGLNLAFGETSGGFRRLIQIVFGLSIAFAASSFFLSFFQFGGGVLV